MGTVAGTPALQAPQRDCPQPWLCWDPQGPRGAETEGTSRWSLQVRGGKARVLLRPLRGAWLVQAGMEGQAEPFLGGRGPPKCIQSQRCTRASPGTKSTVNCYSQCQSVQRGLDVPRTPLSPLGLPEPGGLMFMALSTPRTAYLVSVCYCSVSVLLPGSLPLLPQVTPTVSPGAPCTPSSHKHGWGACRAPMWGVTGLLLGGCCARRNS